MEGRPIVAMAAKASNSATVSALTIALQNTHIKPLEQTPIDLAVRAPTSSDSTNSPFPLMKLPIELRLTIYEMVFEDIIKEWAEYRILSWHTWHFNWHWERRALASRVLKSLRLLHVCHTMRVDIIKRRILHPILKHHITAMREAWFVIFPIDLSQGIDVSRDEITRLGRLGQFLKRFWDITRIVEDHVREREVAIARAKRDARMRGENNFRVESWLAGVVDVGTDTVDFHVAWE